jgi:hypothetical protein
MQRLFLSMCLLCVVHVGYAEDTPILEPLLTDGIKLPEPPQGEDPPRVEPATVITDLNAGELYIVESTTSPCIVVDSRQGLVDIRHLKGPVTFFAKFVDGKVRTVEEERVVAGPDIYVIRAVKQGNVEILIIPKGAENNDGIHRRVLNVMGQAPNPPPDVIPTPPPTPPPTPDVTPTPPPTPPPLPADGKRVLIVYESIESAKLTADQSAAINGTPFRAYLTRVVSKGPDGVTPEWRIWDKDVSLASVSDTWKKAMALERKSVPWLIVSNGISGYSGVLPKTMPEIEAIVQQYLGN